ncbi:MAG: ferritin-like domain-containing protein [Candidatus Eremiobacteraeota bacterium]|nr:ferritin-like domain-containing protein [Candidatus Eremiobacteraeota bacterium]
MGEHEVRSRLIGILRSAYSGELAAALAYRGHWRSLVHQSERAAVARIERDEWTHRTDVGTLLRGLGAQPQALRDVLMTVIGTSVAVSCHLGNRILPLYFAGKLEHSNIAEYEDAAACARDLKLPDYERALLEMAETERSHEAFFLRAVAPHGWLPLLRRLFHWG